MNGPAYLIGMVAALWFSFMIFGFVGMIIVALIGALIYRLESDLEHTHSTCAKCDQEIVCNQTNKGVSHEQQQD